jgi:glycine betaine/choline ABC-type transport system substrate-binding protein
MKNKKWIHLLLTIVVIFTLTACGGGARQDGDTQGNRPAETPGTIVIGSKNFTENIIIAHMMAELIENNTDLKVERRVNLGGSNVAWKALLNNDIHNYTRIIQERSFRIIISKRQAPLRKRWKAPDNWYNRTDWHFWILTVSTIRTPWP